MYGHISRSVASNGVRVGGSVRPRSASLAPNTSGFTHLGLHSSGAGPRWGTPRASPPPPGAPGGDIPVKPEVFLTPSLPTATVSHTLPTNHPSMNGRGSYA